MVKRRQQKERDGGKGWRRRAGEVKEVEDRRNEHSGICYGETKERRGVGEKDGMKERCEIVKEK